MALISRVAALTGARRAGSLGIYPSVIGVAGLCSHFDDDFPRVTVLCGVHRSRGFR